MKMLIASFYFLLFLFRSTSYTIKRIIESKPLDQDDYALGSTLNIRKDLLNLFPNVGGPKSAPNVNSSSSNKTKDVWAIWPSGVIPYWLDPSFSDVDRAMIGNAFQYVESVTCLRFVPDDDDINPRMDIISDNLGGYCYTMWHTDGREDTYAEVHLTPSSSCTVPRTIIHELMHGIAFFHTHKRRDRDEHVKIEWENIHPDMIEEFEICSGCCCNTHGIKYDCSSIMHYARNQMSRNGSDTITALNETCYIPEFSEWNYHEPKMSKSDIEAVQIQYGQYC